MNCKDCPSYIGVDEYTTQKDVVGKTMPVPMCGRFGHVLGRPNDDDTKLDRIGENYAADCPNYGDPLPPRETRVFLAKPFQPDPTAAADVQPTKSVTTCTACKNYVPPETVHSEVGYPMGVCRAQGMLIRQPRSACVNCPWAHSGAEAGIDPSMRTTSGLEVNPKLLEVYELPSDKVVAAVRSLGGDSEEPTTRPTDKPVTVEDQARGIRAWRKISDPKGKKHGYIPIFRRDIFTPEEQALIPATGDNHHPELYIDYDGRLWRYFVESYALKETFVLIGAPGIGKTEFFRWLAYLMQVPFVRIPCTNRTDIEDFVGTTHAVDGEKGTITVFKKGRLAYWYDKVCVLLVDEPNTLPDDCWQFVRPMTDGEKTMFLDQAGGENIHQGHDCYLGFAINPAWDFRNLGTNEMSDANTGRLSGFAVKMPPESIERAIIKDACRAMDDYDIPKETLDFIMDVAKDIRSLNDDGAYPTTWGIRMQVKVARKTAWYDLLTCYRAASTDFHEPAVGQMVLNAVESHLSNKRDDK